MDTSGKELETQKQLMTLQKRIEILENENTQLKSRLRDVAKIKGEADVQEYIARNKVRFKFLYIPYFHSNHLTSLYCKLRNKYELLFQLTDICEVTAVLTECTTNLGDKKDVKVEACDQNDPKSSDEQPKVTLEANDSNQLISFGGNAGNDEKLDGLSLDDLNGKNTTR